MSNDITKSLHTILSFRIMSTKFRVACLSGLVIVIIAGFIYFNGSDNKLPNAEHSKQIRGDAIASNGPECAAIGM